MRVALALLLLTIPSIALAEADWKQLSDEDGITVWERTRPGSDFVEFRGRGLVGAPIPKVLAVLRDQDRKIEWMERCQANQAIAYGSGGEMVVYHRIGSPFFTISERDVVLKVRGDFDPKARSITINFETTEHKLAPRREGVVRMPMLKGYWKLSPRGQQTEVEYQVLADPGGSLPAFVVNWASRGIPRNTLLGLRAQLKKPGYEKELAAVESTYDWEPFLSDTP